jgi:hypothetical protein
MGKGYNLATILATITEHLLHVKYLIKNGYPVNTLYIGLDIDFCFGVKMHNDQDYLLKLHPDVSNTNPIGFYWSYLSVLPKGDIKRKLRANFGKKKGPPSQFGKDGALALGSEAENSPIFFEDRRILGNYVIENKMGRENLEALRELVAFCRQHHINFILFTTPHHRMVLDHFLEEDYISFLRGLSEITPFWDFSGYNSVTTDNKNYLDHSHYNPSVSRWIAARIFNDQTVMVPKDFGVWVTRKNIDSHLENLKMGFEKNNRSRFGSQRLD